MIKTPRKLNQYFGRSLKTVGLALITCSIFVAGCKISKPELSLPTEKAAQQRLMQIYEDKEKIYLLKENKIFRHPYNANGVIKVNITFQPTALQKIALETSLKEFNQVFEVVNPNYKFQLNYTPTQQDLLEPYNVDIEIVKTLGGNANFYTAGITNSTITSNVKEVGGGAISDSVIQLPESTLKNFFNLTAVFKHEFSHVLGLGDAYLNVNATQDTIMQNRLEINSLQNYDVAFIDALYRAPDNVNTDQQMNEYIQNYQKTNTHTPAHAFSELIYENLAGVDLEDFKKFTSFWHASKPEIISWINNLSSLESLDKTFEQTDFKFAEIKQDGFSYFPHSLSHFQFQDDQCIQNVRDTKNNVKSYPLNYASANGFIFLTEQNKFFFSVDGFILEGSYDQQTAEIKEIKQQKLYQQTTLTAQQYFDAALNEEKALSKSTNAFHQAQKKSSNLKAEKEFSL